MAQRTEKEETEFKVVPESLTLCINNCGVTGNPATNNMCQKCFNGSTSTTSSGVAGTGGIKFNDKSRRSTSLTSPGRRFELPGGGMLQDRVATVEEKEIAVVSAKKEVNRCSGCRRKVGLTGFRCRCGDLFCSEHRYSDRHDCSYDYKAAGREAIARENPVVKAAKMVRI